MTNWPKTFREARRSAGMLKPLNHHHFRKQIRGTALKIKWCLKPKHLEKYDFVDPVHLNKHVCIS